MKALINIGFDGQIYLAQKQGGIRNYFSNIIRIFLEDKSYQINPFFYFVKKNNGNIKELSNKYDELEFKGIKNLFETFTPRFSTKSISLIHQTFYFPYLHNLFPYIPHVTTVHDMIPELFPSQKNLHNPHFSKKTYYEKSKGIIAVSNTTLRDLIAIYGKNRNEVRRIYHGVNSSIFKPGKKEHRDPFFLYVGKRDSYKNAVIAINAMANVPSNVRLIFVGGGKLSKQEGALIASLGLSNQIRQISASELELASLYQQAVGLILTSKYEGFGLPAVEAMASGCPVIAARSDCTFEICNEHAAYFDSENVESLSERLTQVLTESVLREELSYSGYIRSQEFSWEKCAKETAKFYFDLLS